MSKTHAYLLVATVLPSCAACGPAVEEDEAPILFERRRPHCQSRCELLLDPDCGAEGLELGSVDECVENCMSEDFSVWGLLPDGTDKCFNETVVYYECIDSLTCSEQRLVNTLPSKVNETECGDEQLALTECTPQAEQRK